MIGLLDSGIGGLTAVRALCRRQPGLACLYMADTAFLPYGEKDAAALVRRAEAALSFFCREGAEAVLFACGTLSAVALPHLSCRDIPVFGVLTPAADAAARATGCGRVLVLATEASVASDAYLHALSARGVQAKQIACPLFVPLCESGRLAPDDPILARAVAQTLPRGCEDGADTVLLGCTHYTWLVPALQRRFPGLTLIDAAGEAAKACLAALPETVRTTCPDAAAQILPDVAPLSAAMRPEAVPFPETKEPHRLYGGCRFVATGDAAAFARAASSLLKFSVRASSVPL